MVAVAITTNHSFIPQRRDTLYLEVSDTEIFYRWNYDPPVPLCGGGSGGVWPGGFMYDVPYEQLRALGSGTHSLEFDESTPRKTVDRPTQTEDDRLFERLRFELFSERAGSSIAGGRFCSLLLAMTPGNVDRIIPLLNEAFERLEGLCRKIGGTRAEREQEGHWILHSYGSTTTVPDENLVIIRNWFGQEAK